MIKQLVNCLLLPGRAFLKLLAILNAGCLTITMLMLQVLGLNMVWYNHLSMELRPPEKLPEEVMTCSVTRTEGVFRELGKEAFPDVSGSPVAVWTDPSLPGQFQLTTGRSKTSFCVLFTFPDKEWKKKSQQWLQSKTASEISRILFSKCSPSFLRGFGNLSKES